MEWPPYREYFPALVRLLQGVVYADDEKYWSLVLNYRKEIESYFLKIGLQLYVVEHEEFAYLRSVPREEAPVGFADLPKLTRRRQLAFPVTIICLLLKKQYIQHQENVGSFEPPTIHLDELFESYHNIPAVAKNDEWRSRQHFEAQFNKVKNDLRLVKETGVAENEYRILPAINALVNVDFMDQAETLAVGRSASKASEEIDLE